MTHVVNITHRFMPSDLSRFFPAFDAVAIGFIRRIHNNRIKRRMLKNIFNIPDITVNYAYFIFRFAQNYAFFRLKTRIFLNIYARDMSSASGAYKQHRDYTAARTHIAYPVFFAGTCKIGKYYGVRAEAVFVAYGNAAAGTKIFFAVHIIPLSIDLFARKMKYQFIYNRHQDAGQQIADLELFAKCEIYTDRKNHCRADKVEI